MATIGLSYDGLVTELYTLLQTNADDQNFANTIPNMINDAEQRIYREVDFLATRDSPTPLPMTISNRIFVVPAEINVVEAPCVMDLVYGKRQTLFPISLDALNFAWPQSTGIGATGMPQYYCMLDTTRMLVAPTPDQAYLMEVTGTFRPQPMSETNQNTYLGTNFPELFLAACMVFATAHQRDWGAMSDDPRMSLSWESHYQTLKSSVIEEDMRRKGMPPQGSPPPQPMPPAAQ